MPSIWELAAGRSSPERGKTEVATGDGRLFTRGAIWVPIPPVARSSLVVTPRWWAPKGAMMSLILPGELITCEKGHVVAAVVALIRGIDHPDGVRAGFWRPGVRVANGECICGAVFWRAGAWHVHNRGWVEVADPNQDRPPTRRASPGTIPDPTPLADAHGCVAYSSGAAIGRQDGVLLGNRQADVKKGRWVVGVFTLAMTAVMVSVDVAFFRIQFWERLMVNIGVVLVFAACYLRFPRHR